MILAGSCFFLKYKKLDRIMILSTIFVFELPGRKTTTRKGVCVVVIQLSRLPPSIPTKLSGVLVRKPLYTPVVMHYTKIEYSG